jgi:hypothetical protein
VNAVPADLPGHELVSAGLTDLADGRETEAALLVAMAAPRLRALGFDVPAAGIDEPSHRLYELLSESEGGHSRYNALVGRIVSFARAAEHAATSASCTTKSSLSSTDIRPSIPPHSGARSTG